MQLEMGNGLSDQTSILSSLPSFQSFHIVILGLDCAGKTTVLYRLQFNEFVNTVPTKGFNTEKIKVTLGNSKTVTFHFWDVGGQEKLRPLWKSYTRCTDGIVFVVDSVDVERMETPVSSVFLFFVCLCWSFCLFRATPAAYGGSQARDRIRAAAAGLHHTHSNMGSEPRLGTIPQVTANARSLIH